MAVAPGSFITRSMPTFESKAAERIHALQRLAGTCRIFGRRGFAEGLLGHITVRDPEYPDLLWVNPLGVSMSRMKVSDLVQANHRGEIVTGSRAANAVGLLLHTAVHKARPDVMAVCHAHSLYGSAWASLERVLDPISQDACVFFENQALIVEPRVALDAETAARFAAGLGDKRVAIQSGHGIFATGQSIDEAAWWFVLMERCCQAQLLAEAAGAPKHWPAERARGVAMGLGSPMFGWQSFQTLWDEIIVSEPDLVD